MSKRLSVAAIDHIVINTSDPQPMAEGYLTLLGMKHPLVSSKQGDAPRNILLFGKQKINLRSIKASQKT